MLKQPLDFQELKHAKNVGAVAETVRLRSQSSRGVHFSRSAELLTGSRSQFLTAVY